MRNVILNTSSNKIFLRVCAPVFPEIIYLNKMYTILSTSDAEEDADSDNLLPKSSPQSSTMEAPNKRKFKPFYFLTFSLLVLYILFSVTFENRFTFIYNDNVTSSPSTLFQLPVKTKPSTTPATARPPPKQQMTTTKLPKSTTLAPTVSTGLSKTIVDDFSKLHSRKEGSPQNESVACNIPQLKPFDASIKHLVEIPNRINCTAKHPLLFDSSVNSTLNVIGNQTDFEGIESCCYRSVKRGNGTGNNADDTSVASVNCTAISLKKTSIKIPATHEFIVVQCKFLNITETNTTKKADSSSESTERESSSTKSMDMHLFVPLKAKVETRIRKYYKNVAKIISKVKKKGTTNNKHILLEEKDRVNIVIFGIDAVSHMNFIRVMPETHKYVKNELNAVEMNGFNKIGDNTYPNLAAFLTALNTSTISKTCEKNKFFDKCPFIWKKLSASGYRTSLAEDSPNMSGFNYLKRGFMKPPTDYYLRPFLTAAEELIGTNKEGNAKLCYGPRLAFDINLDYLKKMAFTMGKDKRYFQVIWATALTHDFLNYGRLADEQLLATLKWLNEGGYFNQTIFMLMSDHGMRWGTIHEYLQGQLEDRLPFIYFVVPKWFQAKYPKAFENLKLNGEKRRLTTNFDLHETMLDLMNLTSINCSVVEQRQENLNKLDTLPRGISQFLAIPPSRTCEMAGIPQHFCSCHNLREVSKTKPEVEQAANFIVYYINKKLSKNAECAVLRLEKIKLAHEIDYGWDKEVVKGFELTVETIPGHGLFEAAVLKRTNHTWKLSGPIGRGNLYGNQSHCVNVKELKLFCYCVDNLGIRK